jgi:hypothetical protein
VPTTNAYGFTIQQGADPADGVSAVSALASSVGPYSNMRFASAAARDTLLTTPLPGMVAWLTDVHALTYYDGTSWVTMVAGVYASYTLAIQGTGSPTVGNGTVTTRWSAVGKQVHGQGALTLGSTTSFGTASAFFTLPVPARDLATPLIGWASLFDTSAGTAGRSALCGCHLDTTSRFNIVAATGEIVSGALPFSWASTDVLRFNFSYEAA